MIEKQIGIIITDIVKLYTRISYIMITFEIVKQSAS